MRMIDNEREHIACQHNRREQQSIAKHFVDITQHVTVLTNINNKLTMKKAKREKKNSEDTQRCYMLAFTEFSALPLLTIGVIIMVYITIFVCLYCDLVSLYVFLFFLACLFFFYCLGGNCFGWV